MILAEVPNPESDWEGYMLWCEMSACTVCDGEGEDIDDGEAWMCDHCGGTGIEPGIEDDDDE